jgi:protein arginine N-methyltransferase 5
MSAICGTAPSLGCEAQCLDILTSLDKARLAGCDFIVAPLTNGSDQLIGTSGTASLLRPSQWAHLVVGILTPVPSLGAPALTDFLNEKAEESLLRELSWAIHLGMRIVLAIPPPSEQYEGNGVNEFARIIVSALNMQSAPAIWIRSDLGLPDVDGRDISWDKWNTLRVAANAHDALFICLDIHAHVPPLEYVERWLAEPVRAAMINTSAFTCNAAGFPVLSIAHQELIKMLISYGVQIYIAGTADQLNNEAITLAATAAMPDSESARELEAIAANPLRAYTAYINHISKRITPLSGRETAMERLVDALQMPLQPLGDNLESSSYEAFEDDAPKYDAYERAITAALRDAPSTRIVSVVFVVGAGRGPIVSRVIAASTASQRAVRIWAIDKNPNAVVALRSIIAAAGWQNLVTVIHADMRTWVAPEFAHILVSELLGSFGDNELSPECLEGAKRLLIQEGGGITIPRAYKSFLAPVSASKLWSDVRRLDNSKWFDTTFVARMRRIATLSPAQPLFTFEHISTTSASTTSPSTITHYQHRRANTLTYEIAHTAPSAVLHGFAGYFEAELYDGVMLSTRPLTHTPHMLSWFPLFIPIRQPIIIHAKEKVRVNFSRSCDTNRVWYEWSITDKTPIQNVRGWASSIALT